MCLTSLRIHHCRIIESAELNPSPTFNLIVGPNASGKTSLLEAIDVLSRGRSFRTRLSKDLISHGQPRLVVGARHQSCQESGYSQIGISKTRRNTRVRIQGHTSQHVAPLAKAVPLQSLHPDSHRLVQGPPAYRRSFIDWGVFHVEPDFLAKWRRYHQLLKQRNAALRNRTVVEPWSDELSEVGERINAFREDYLTGLQAVINEYASALITLDDLTIHYRRGWPDAMDLRTALHQACSEDAERGFTSVGIHRAELTIHLNKRSAASVASRGQQKLLAILLILSQIEHFVRHSGRPCILLIDDLPAELDPRHQARVLSILLSLNIQLFITSTTLTTAFAQNGSPTKTFHVEQGKVTEVV